MDRKEALGGDWTAAVPPHSSFASRMALWSARHRRAVALGWVAIIATAFGACSMIPANTDVSQEVPGESGAALRLYRERFGEAQAPAQEIVVFS